MKHKYFLLNGDHLNHESLNSLEFKISVNENLKITSISLSDFNPGSYDGFSIEYWDDEIKECAYNLIEELIDEIEFFDDE